MPRRPNDLTPSDLTGTPTDAAPPARDTPPRLPRPPARPGPPRLPGVAQPGRRGNVPSDLQMTKKLERLPRREPTPAPLPPSPGARDAERWFEQVPTNPALDGGREATGSHRRTARTGAHALDTRPVPAWADRPWVLPALIAAVALTIGMILGALLFGGRSDACPPCGDAADQAKP